jgi:hypothetical protein
MALFLLLALGGATNVSPLSIDPGETQVAPEPDRPPEDRRVDSLFPRGGTFSATVGTGVPFIGIGEIAYGITDRFALGAIGGGTPNVGGVGVRPRVLIVDADAWRLHLTVPILYYPKTRELGGDPWMLTRPALVLDREIASGVRLGAGMGLVAAACTESIFSLGKEHDSEFMGGVWNTVNVGASVQVSSRTSLFGDVALVMRGVRVAGSEWIGGPPVIAAFGVTTRL